MKHQTRTILFVLFGLLLTVALVTLVALSKHTKEGSLCQGVKITVITDSLGVLAESQVRDFMTLHVTPVVSKPLDSISLADIEKQLELMPLIDQAECYIDNKGFLRVEVTEMIPIMHILGVNHDYCVDINARQMPTPNPLRKDVALVEGSNVSLQFATTELFDLMVYIRDSGWSSEFTQFRVGSGNKVSMLSNTYGYWVILGVPDEYVRKFDKLVHFRHSLPTHTQYKEINLDYFGQVICK